MTSRPRLWHSPAALHANPALAVTSMNATTSSVVAAATENPLLSRPVAAAKPRIAINLPPAIGP
jgi:hypothetical protein